MSRRRCCGPRRASSVSARDPLMQGGAGRGRRTCTGEGCGEADDRFCCLLGPWTLVTCSWLFAVVLRKESTTVAPWDQMGRCNLRLVKAKHLRAAGQMPADPREK